MCVLLIFTRTRKIIEILLREPTQRVPSVKQRRLFFSPLPAGVARARVCQESSSPSWSIVSISIYLNHCCCFCSCLYHCWRARLLMKDKQGGEILSYASARFTVSNLANIFWDSNCFAEDKHARSGSLNTSEVSSDRSQRNFIFAHPEKVKQKIRMRAHPKGFIIDSCVSCE